MDIIVVESPFASDDPLVLADNIIYARRAMKSVIDLGGIPFASHLLFTQVMDDTDLSDRQKGISFGFAFWQAAKTVRFFNDYGMSPGMENALMRAQEMGKSIELAYIGKNGEPLDEAEVFIPYKVGSDTGILRADSDDNPVIG